ncbi:MAG: serine hydroxymethyltransferase [Oscillospiraceae bacterium]|jgi:glycine hydroxymethyltransferase|nr:serine hydroxymethyltransferase [Oscillospiraceae bacterium]
MYNLKKIGNFVSRYDAEIGECLSRELLRQQNTLELIASENFASPFVLASMGSVLTNKYAEGYPRRRYYGGCEFVDQVEDLAVERACKLFKAEHANVQPHSGASANLAVYYAFLKPEDTVLGMALSSGGHLTHGSKFNISGKYFNFFSYDVDYDTQYIDYGKLYKDALKIKPKMIVCGASAYSRIIDFKKFRDIADACNAYLMVDMAHIAGLVAAGAHPNPVPIADVVTTTTHKTLRGPRSGLILCKKKYAKKVDSAVFPGIQGGPFMHIIAAKAVCFKEAASEEFSEYIRKVVDNSRKLALKLKEKGMKLISGGTDNHLILLDLRHTKTTGKKLQLNLEDVNIAVNKNTIPNEKLGSNETSGIRLGTAAVTSRGMGLKEMDHIAELIFVSIKDFKKNKAWILAEVGELCKKFPLYGEKLESFASTIR